jgi:Zn-dependent protease with chaperone function
VDFFASQELARRNTRKLVILLFITILALILAIYAIILFVFGGLVLSSPGSPEMLRPEDLLTPEKFFSAENLGLFGFVSLLVGSVVFFSSLFKIQELHKGGPVVAELLGGRKIPTNTRDFSERRILNIVEEMSLASGVAVPPVYVLEGEPGINAFAAGHTIDDAVIGINRGTLDKLNREELQGVIAHEFSHILNGDMKMSLRMIGLLYGIQALAIIGMYMNRAAADMSHGRRNEKEGNPAVILFIIGTGLLVIGSVGLFFARLIKASVSRQREYLADASAVQFTRFPEGIGGALKMIGAESASSRVRAADAESISHMFFANMYGSSMQNFFATHPPLVPRIQRIEPRFRGNFGEYLKSRPTASIHDREKEEEEHQRHLAFARRFGMLMGRMEGALGGGAGLPGMGVLGGLERVFPMDPAVLIAAIGSPREEDMTYAQILLKNISPQLLDDCHEMFTARCIVFASILDQEEPETRQQQIELLKQREDEPTVIETLRQEQQIRQIDLRFRLPIFEIIQGTLSSISIPQLQQFEDTLKQLVMADRNVDLFEFFLFHHLIIHIRRHLGVNVDRESSSESLNSFRNEVETLLSVVARIGHQIDTDAVSAFNAASQHLTNFQPPLNLQANSWDYRTMFEVMHKLSSAAPKAKKQLLEAIGVMIIHDQKITIAEAELFRAISESLDCPVPPVLATEHQ